MPLLFRTTLLALTFSLLSNVAIAGDDDHEVDVPLDDVPQVVKDAALAALPGLVLSRAGSAGNPGPAEPATLQGHFGFNRRITPRVDDLAAAYCNNCRVGHVGL